MKQRELKSLFDQHFDALRNYIYYRCGDSELATDVVQEVFIKIWEKQVDVEERITPLLYKMAKDNMISKLRHHKVVRDYETAPHYHSTSVMPDEALEGEELMQKYEKTLAEMPEGPRVVFLMSRNEEMKYSEIAERLGLSLKAVEKRMTHALSILRSSLLILLCQIIVHIKDWI